MPRVKEYLQAKDYEYTLTSTPQSRTLSTSGTIIGQPLNAQYRYKFTYSTGETPFVMLPLTENSKLYQHLPSQGELVITDHYTQSNVIRVLPSKVDRLKASVLFNNVPVGDLLWSTVIGNK